jgi:threonyl-tRNA synthetase
MQDSEIAHAAQVLEGDEAYLYRIRHSLAHVLAQAVLSVQPEARLGFGPPVEHGFYYDFDLPEPITADDLPKIEKKMRQILQEKQAFVRSELPPADALAKAEAMRQPYKVEAVNDLQAKGVPIISFYQNGPFVDMCEGPHCADTKEIRSDAFLLDSIAGAYWKGSEKNKMLTRIYGLAFATGTDLKEFLARRKLAQERDHRKLGRELDLFHIDDEVGKGLILWLPKGTVLRDEIEAMAKEYEFRYGYERVATPHITKQELYYRSGHLPYYKESMFPPLELTVAGEEHEDEKQKEVFYLKPMNCPHHHMIYRARPHSYRDLPLRLAEYGTCYRYEKSGELSGLLRVRCLTMNDAHIYCAPEQLQDEITSLLQMYQEQYAVFGLTDFSMRLSLHDPGNTEKYQGDEELWQRGEDILREALEVNKLKYYVGTDEAAFYGPKIDVQFRTLMGREESVSTIQVDFMAAKKFELRYVDEHGEEKSPVVIHRAPLSTHERMLSYLIEHYGGAFPTWLAPVQVRVLAVVDDLVPYAEDLVRKLREDEVRAEVDLSPHSFNKRIRLGTLEKIPILLVVGRKEAAEGTVTVRRYKIEKQVTLPFDQFHTELLEEIATRRHVQGID